MQLAHYYQINDAEEILRPYCNETSLSGIASSMFVISTTFNNKMQIEKKIANSWFYFYLLPYEITWNRNLIIVNILAAKFRNSIKAVLFTGFLLPPCSTKSAFISSSLLSNSLPLSNINSSIALVSCFSFIRSLHANTPQNLAYH